MCSDEGRVVDWLLDDARVDATAGLLPRGAAAGEGLRGRAHLARLERRVGCRDLDWHLDSYVS